ncbi:MAG TPA: CapA family protein [Candidatus Paceibacterota bacterium]
MNFVAAVVAAVMSLFQAPVTSPQANILFAGDMMFDRTVRTAMQRNGGDFIFFCVDPFLKKADAVVANLEGPITDSPSRSVGSFPGSPNNFIFTFPRTTAQLLYDHHIRIVNYGNNHILNFGVGGLDTTEKVLDDAGVAYFGQAAGRSWVYRTSINNVPLEFINYNEFAHSTGSGQGGNASTTVAQIVRAKEEGYLPVVYTHWGIEYETTAPQYLRDLAHRFVDAGAVAVIGSHPHVVQDHEIYLGAPIYYSLGNFIFDQYFSDDVKKGLLVQLTFGTSTVTGIEEIPITLNKDRTVCPAGVQ